MDKTLIPMNPIVSIIIPCYNSGNYLPETIASVQSYPNKETYEIIIINDGSEDEHTLQVLKDLAANGFQIIDQPNQGPASARNTGIKRSKGKYLIFLDSDNKIRSELLDKGIEVLDNNPNVGVVYGNPNFFGDVQEHRKWRTYDFDMERMLMLNYIDVCSMIRKEVWDDLDGLDESKIIMGFEDWEFWIRVGKSKWEFCYLNKILYDYRITSNSLITTSLNINNRKTALQYIYKKHIDLVVEYMLDERYRTLYESYATYQQDKSKPIRSFVKFAYLKYFKKK